MKKLLFPLGIALVFLWSCNENQSFTDVNETTIEQQVNGHGDHPQDDYIEELREVDGKMVVVPTMEFEETISDESYRSVSMENPHGLAAALHSPFYGNAETHPSWSPPSHWRPWGGDWAVDLWTDNGNNDGTDYGGPTCNQNVYIDARPIVYPGGNAPQSLKAKLISHGYACANGNYSYGGYAQKWQIIATYNGAEYALGWMLYAHLSSVQYTSTGTEVNLSPATYIGKTFSGSIYSGCWGSCHIHMEFYNYRKYSCYDVMPPTVNIDRVGVVGCLASSTQHCPSFAPTNLAENAINCIRSSAYNNNFDCNKAYDGSLSTKWTSNGSSQQSSMVIDLGSVKSISKIVVKHASAGGEANYYNTKHFKIEYGNNSIWGPWTLAGHGYNWSQADSETILNLNFNARYVHLYIVNPGIDNYARIPEFQVFGN